jgi:hypothetical protein
MSIFFGTVSLHTTGKMSDPCLIAPLLTKLGPYTASSLDATTTEPGPNTSLSLTMNRSQQANAVAVAPNRGGCKYKGGCEHKKTSKSLRQLIDERLAQKKAMTVANTPMPTVTAPRKTTKTDSTMLSPHPPVSRPVVSKSKNSTRMQRQRQQARRRDASPSPSSTSSRQMQRQQQAQQRNASPSPSCSSASVTSYTLKVVAPSDNHSHSAAATVCSSSCSVSSCSVGTSIRVLAGKKQQKDNMRNHSAPEHRTMATSRVGKHLSIPTTAALHSSFSPTVNVTSVSVPIATAVAQSRNQNHLMSRYSSSPQKQRPQRRQPCSDPPRHDEKSPAPHRKQESVFFDFEDNKIIPSPKTICTATTTIIPRSHVKKPLAQDLSLKKKSDVLLRKITKSNSSQSPPLKTQERKRVEDSPANNIKCKDVVTGSSSSSSSKHHAIAPGLRKITKNNTSQSPPLKIQELKRVDDSPANYIERKDAVTGSSNNQHKIVDNGNINMSQGGRVSGRLSTPLARSRRFQSWSNSRKQKHAAYSSGASLNGE